jgi:hypothetical protein
MLGAADGWRVPSRECAQRRNVPESVLILPECRAHIYIYIYIYIYMSCRYEVHCVFMVFM